MKFWQALKKFNRWGWGIEEFEEIPDVYGENNWPPFVVLILVGSLIVIAVKV